MSQPLIVYLRDAKVGSLHATDSPGEYLFAYDAAIAATDPAASSLSVSLPVRSEAYRPAEARPFFDGLLPERGVREQLAANLRVDPDNSFELFARIGRDCAGAVVILPEGETLAETASIVWLDDRQLEGLVRDLPTAPLGVDAASRVRLSLAGLQSKAVLVRSGSGAYGLPSPAAPSTHLIKPQYEDARFGNLVYNERFCMRVAESVGLEVARTDLIFVGERPCLLVERFDRSTDGTGTVRLHQEDLCQALGLSPTLKYEQQGGPGLGRIGALLREVSERGSRDVLSLLRMVIVNYVLGNNDAHAKNFALLYGEGGLQLAPFYDIVSSAVYEQHETAMAMALGGEFEQDRIGLAEVRGFAEECGFSASATVAEWRKVAGQTATCAERIADLMKAEGLHVPTLDHIVALARDRAGRI
jgi:serine/threonine-protein kinase HipA